MGKNRGPGKRPLITLDGPVVSIELGPCWLWLGAQTDNGYGLRWIDGKRVRAHRAAYQAATGTDPGDLMVCHKCDNRLCVRPDHLYLGTNTDNIGDMVRRRRHRSALSPQATLRGERNPMSKLSDEQVAQILALRGVKRQRDIAVQFGITEDYVSQLMRGYRRATGAK